MEEHGNIFSILVNGGKTVTNFANQNIRGFDFSGELNLYGQVLMSDKWNEYGGIKVAYGSFTNKSVEEDYNYYFVGVATGVQPVLMNSFTLRVSADLGYIRNGLTNKQLYTDRSVLFYSGFAILLNMGIGVKL